MEGGSKGTLKAVALIVGDNNVRGSLHFSQFPNGFFSLSLLLLRSNFDAFLLGGWVDYVLYVLGI